MTPAKQLLHQLIHDYEGDDLPGYLHERLATIERIKGEIHAAYCAREEAEKQHRAVLAQIEKRVSVVQAECPHLSVTYHGDPSGGNDSETRCDHCEKSL